ncbi:hypothetical protein [Blastopirellula marina]|uniref:Uncharacterized protein n=1 Tax=Blastopirellula marina TaxID=124 RepID=A0A2S8GUR6_9BACT|nr:hypothetical protein [Blastopirellula marina]PQO47794.1 hypothetical protein C5Y93_01760 [Blastopirellula marina]
MLERTWDRSILILALQLPINPGWLSAALALLIGGVGAVLLARARGGVQGTTLTAAWAWTLISWLGLVGCEVGIGIFQELNVPIVASQWRYLATIGMFLPMLAQLGAKRKHLAVWQLLVAGYWLALCVPVFKSWFFGTAGEIDPGWAWGVFLAILIILGLLNNGLTRFGPTALCLAVAQGVMIYPYLPWTIAQVTTGGALLALAIVLLGIVLASCGWPGPREAIQAEDRAWFDFRDRYGSFWALRVMQCVSEAAVRYEWGLWLGWDGFRQVEIAGSDPEFREEVHQGVVACLRKVLGDFVAPEWLDARLPPANPKKAGMDDIEA